MNARNYFLLLKCLLWFRFNLLIKWYFLLSYQLNQNIMQMLTISWYAALNVLEVNWHLHDLIRSINKKVNLWKDYLNYTIKCYPFFLSLILELSLLECKDCFFLENFLRTLRFCFVLLTSFLLFLFVSPVCKCSSTLDDVTYYLISRFSHQSHYN